MIYLAVLLSGFCAYKYYLWFRAKKRKEEREHQKFRHRYLIWLKEKREKETKYDKEIIRLVMERIDYHYLGLDDQIRFWRYELEDRCEKEIKIQYRRKNNFIKY